MDYFDRRDREGGRGMQEWILASLPFYYFMFNLGIGGICNEVHTMTA